MRTYLAAIAAAALLLTLTGCNVTVSGFGDSCAVSEERTATVDAAGARTLRADVDAGSLRVEGVADLKEVQVKAKACARNQSDLSKLELKAERTGDTVQVTTRTVNNSYIDLTLQVPAGLAARIHDGSGEITVRHMGDVEIEDGSGSIDLSSVGSVLIYDGSGDITVQNVGDVEIPDDGSGNIEVRTAGKVRIKDDSGEITLRDVADVTITSDGSGGIEISGVQGNVVVDRDGSGNIAVDDVRGDFTVREDGSGTITHSQVGGHVQIPADKQ
jgi:outer membrane lipopolysaccharide assembly protein LptE/RlpB